MRSLGIFALQGGEVQTEPFPRTHESKLCGFKILANQALHHHGRLDLL
jgi:hypothetical protein